MKPLPHYLIWLVLALCVTLPQVSHSATLTSTVNRNQISTNETLTLIVSIDEQVDSSDLNLNALQENFDILAASPQSRSSINIINGKSEKNASTVWTITLVAKREGIATIPAFSIGSARSKAISIKVSNSASNANSSTLPLAVSVTPSVKSVYPNQQFIVEIELSARGNVRDLNGPQLLIENADVEAFDQQTFQRVDNGIARQIVILKYSVFAKQAGKLVIPVMTYTGLQNARRSLFGANGNQVIARSKPIEITVNEIPTLGNRQWFPADNVSISANLSGDAAILKVGEPITRTITITAEGQQASAIPPLDQSLIDSQLKSYKDQPQLETTKSKQGFIATRIESEAIVANKAGDYVLPEVTIDWWNTRSKQWQTATLKQQTLNVTGLAAPVNTVPTQYSPDFNTDNALPSGASESNKLWQFISAGLGLIVLIQLYFLVGRRENETRTNSTIEKTQTESQAWKSLQSAIKSDNSRAIRNDILLWGSTILAEDGPVSLAKLSQAADSMELKEAFDDLDKHLYKGGDKPNSRNILSALKEFRSARLQSKKLTKTSKPKLRPLYPN